MIARVLVVLGLLLLAVDTVRLTVTGVSVLGAVLIVVGLVRGGVFRRDFWIGEEPPSRSRLDVLDGR